MCLSFYFESDFLFISLWLVDGCILRGRFQDRTPTEPASRGMAPLLREDDRLLPQCCPGG